MIGIGDSLRKARVRRGQTIAECARVTGIGPRFLDALEAERFDDLPPTAHAADLVARYAAHLELDAGRFSDEVRALASDDPDADTQPIPVVRPPQKRDSTLAWVGGGAVIGLGGLILLGGGLGSSGDEATTRSTSTNATTTTTRPARTSQAPTTSTRSPARIPPPAATTTSENVTEPPTTLRPTPPRGAAIQLVLGAKTGKTVWVEVRRGDFRGEQVFAGIVGGGVTRSFRSGTPLWLGVAWAPNLAVTLNGEVIDADGGTETYRVTPRGVTRLNVTSSGTP